MTAGPTIMQGPVSSPDGKKLYAIGGGSLGELLRDDATSRQFQPFLSGISAIQLNFSKDGQWVTYVTYPGGDAVAEPNGWLRTPPTDVSTHGRAVA